jgi:signal transduction histidine kinase
LVKRALAALTIGAFLTLLVGVVGSSGSTVPLIIGAVFVLLGTVGFEWVQRRPRSAMAYAYIAIQLLLSFVVFGTAGAPVGGTLMLVVVVVQSVLVLPLAAVVVVVALAPLVHAGMALRDGLREGLGTLAAMVFAAVIAELLLREQRARRELAEAHGRLQEYAVQAERLATVQERNRVARDIHDGLGHALTVVQMQVKAARAVLRSDPDRSDVMLGKAELQAAEALDEVRRSVAALRDPRPVPLPDALRALVSEASAAGVPTELDVSGTARALRVEAEESLYRAAQEGLTNVRKHAQASRAELRLDYSGPDIVRLEVRDDGAGLAPPGEGGFGLLGVGERAAHVGGRMSITSGPGGGTTLSVEVPG